MVTQFAWFFLSLKGRISRQEFWLGYCLTLAVVLLSIPLLQKLSLALRRPASGPWYRSELEAALLMPRLAMFVAIAWPLTAIFVKRLHDLGYSGWWLLAFIGAMWLTVATGVDHKNWVNVALFAILGLVPGHRGQNQFGADPVA
jgi:uncharacterized membrane protein YhaH (DUF805 family)